MTEYLPIIFRRVAEGETMTFRDAHPVQLAIKRDVRWFSNEQAAVLAGIFDTGTREGFRVVDRFGCTLDFDAVMRIEVAMPETFWPSRWLRRGA